MLLVSPSLAAARMKREGSGLVRDLHCLFRDFRPIMQEWKS